jgi:hypothetical protein
MVSFLPVQLIFALAAAESAAAGMSSADRSMYICRIGTTMSMVLVLPS